MVFSSPIFLLCFLPVCLLLYFAAPEGWRNGVLLLASILFYAWGAPDFVAVLLIATVLNHLLTRAMARTERPRLKKTLCGLAVGVSLALLGWFKYAGFLAEICNSIIGWAGLQQFAWRHVVLPIGISFFTFQSITYTVDVYRGTCPPQDRLTDYMLYILMFPQLIAGPIVRYGDIADQIRHRETRWNEVLEGWYRFIIGLCKKVLVADVIGRWADSVLAGGFSDMSTSLAWTAIVGYTMQLYFDFSGYSDMAIGLGRIFGFRFPENFNCPYISASISEFWRRWHITLGSFMKNYLYIPLGGNRRGRGRTYLNLWMVFLLSGLWHGAGWNFILWGAYHGLWLVLERLGLSRFYQKIGRIPSTFITFLIVVVGWALFRIEDLGQAFTFIGRLFAFDFRTFSMDGEVVLMILVALLAAFLPMLSCVQRLCKKVFHSSYSAKALLTLCPMALLALLICLGSLAGNEFSPFIYFRF